VFTAAGYAFDSEEAFEMERGIFRVIYHAMMESAQLAAEFGAYRSHDGSPLSQGILQPDMWGDYARRLRYVTLEDWDDLRKMVAEHGARNSPGRPHADGDDVHHGIRGRGDGAIFQLVFTARRWRASSSSTALVRTLERGVMERAGQEAHHERGVRPGARRGPRTRRHQALFKTVGT
jgi:hypothetical protein